MGLIITNTGTKALRYVEWGYEGPQTYNPATSLMIDSDNLVTSGFAGSQATHAGAYDPNGAGNQTVHLNVLTTPVAVCGTGDQQHVGTFRVKARVFGAKIAVRLSWQAGDGPVSANPWVPWYELPSVWREIDLGTITVPAGSGRWRGTIEAYTPNQGFGLDVDYLTLVPVTAGYGKARATYSYRPGVISGYDDFTSTTAGGNLNTRAAPAGGTWATSGATTDYVFADDLSDEQVKRSTTSDTGPRWAVLGSATYTNTEVAAKVNIGRTNPSSGTVVEAGLVARWTDSANYLRAFVSRTQPSTGPVTQTLQIVERVAGTDVTIASVSLAAGTFSAGLTYLLRLLAFSSGRVLLTLLNATGASAVASIQGTSANLATAGTLASGKPGIYDRSTSTAAINRYYDAFSVSTPAAEPVVCYAGRTIEITAADVLREDATGTFTGRPQSYRGSRFLVGVGAGRVYVRASSADLDLEADPDGAGAAQISVQASFRHRGLVVPRG